jgi:hypothetical protein
MPSPPSPPQPPRRAAAVSRAAAKAVQRGCSHLRNGCDVPLRFVVAVGALMAVGLCAMSAAATICRIVYTVALPAAVEASPGQPDVKVSNIFIPEDDRRAYIICAIFSIILVVEFAVLGITLTTTMIAEMSFLAWARTRVLRRIGAGGRESRGRKAGTAAPSTPTPGDADADKGMGKGSDKGKDGADDAGAHDNVSDDDDEKDGDDDDDVNAEVEKARKARAPSDDGAGASIDAILRSVTVHSRAADAGGVLVLSLLVVFALYAVISALVSLLWYAGGRDLDLDGYADTPPTEWGPWLESFVRLAGTNFMVVVNLGLFLLILVAASLRGLVALGFFVRGLLHSPEIRGRHWAARAGLLLVLALLCPFCLLLLAPIHAILGAAAGLFPPHSPHRHRASKLRNDLGDFYARVLAVDWMDISGSSPGISGSLPNVSLRRLRAGAPPDTEDSSNDNGSSGISKTQAALVYALGAGESSWANFRASLSGFSPWYILLWAAVGIFGSLAGKTKDGLKLSIDVKAQLVVLLILVLIHSLQPAFAAGVRGARALWDLWQTGAPNRRRKGGKGSAVPPPSTSTPSLSALGSPPPPNAEEGTAPESVVLSPLAAHARGLPAGAAQTSSLSSSSLSSSAAADPADAAVSWASRTARVSAALQGTRVGSARPALPSASTQAPPGTCFGLAVLKGPHADPASSSPAAAAAAAAVAASRGDRSGIGGGPPTRSLAMDADAQCGLGAFLYGLCIFATLQALFLRPSLGFLMLCICLILGGSWCLRKPRAKATANFCRFVLAAITSIYAVLTDSLIESIPNGAEALWKVSATWNNVSTETASPYAQRGLAYSVCQQDYNGASVLDQCFMSYTAYQQQNQSTAPVISWFGEAGRTLVPVSNCSVLGYDRKGTTGVRFDVFIEVDSPAETDAVLSACTLGAPGSDLPYVGTARRMYFIFRGTKSPKDMASDVLTWQEAAFFKLLSYIGPYASWPVQIQRGFVSSLAAFLEWTSSSALNDDVYYLEAPKIVEKYIDKFPSANVSVAGHSLGGGLASLVGQSLILPSLSFSGPGYVIIAGKIPSLVDRPDPFKTPPYFFYADTTVVIPDNDPVPRVDAHVGTRQDITCLGTTSAGKCHSIARTCCELRRVCGDRYDRTLVSCTNGDLLK